MARTIKVHEMGTEDWITREVAHEEAKQIAENAVASGTIIVDAKRQTIIWEIGPEVEEITVLGMLSGG